MGWTRQEFQKLCPTWAGQHIELFPTQQSTTPLEVAEVDLKSRITHGTGRWIHRRMCTVRDYGREDEEVRGAARTG